MAKVRFGSKQLKNPTPSKVGKALDITSAVLGVLVGYIGTAPYIPSNITIILSSIFGLLVALCQVLKPFFGINTSMKKVPIEDVSQMDEPDKVDISKFPPSPEPQNKP